MPTFRQNFRVGDIIYGLDRTRDVYAQSLDANVRDAQQQEGSFTLDYMNDKSFLEAFRNSGNLPKPGNPSATLTTVEQKMLSAWYKKLLSSPRSPKKAMKAPDAKLRKYDGETQDQNELVAFLMIRRACKYGLQYYIEVLKKTVHFCLDIPVGVLNVGITIGTEMRSRHVVDNVKFSGGQPMHLGAQVGQIPITTSELRCCYRNRNKWIPTGRLKFYLDLSETEPPWATDPLVWADYQTHREEKYPFKKKLGRV